MSFNFLDKSGLTYFWDKIKGMFLKLSGGTMTGQLKTSFKSSVAIGSYAPSATTIPNLCTELRYSSGCIGSFSLSTAYTYSGITIPTGWYNFLWIPHRSGGVNGTASGDNCDYGTFLLSGMNNANGMFRIRYSNGSVQECRRITDNSLISNFIANSNSYINTHPENSPVLIPFMHNDIAFLLKRGGSIKAYYDDVEKTLSNQDAMFDACPNYWVQNPTGITKIVLELTLHKVFTWSNTIYCDFGSAGWRAKAVKIEVMNTNYAEDVWTSKYNTTTNGSGNVKITFNHTPVGASNAGGGFNKIRFTFSDWATATIFRIAQLGVYNYGSLGLRETSMSRGVDDYIFRNITPNNNNTFNLGDSSHKWANVYATTFNGNATSATKATQDSDGNTINTTYYKASNPNGYTSNTGTITGITMNGASKGTSGVVDLGTVITAHQDISGKQDKLTAGSNIQITNNTISATDTTYSSKAAASGGTDVSLVTTGEKYTWNSKTSNTGTVTSVAVKMNGSTKGTVTTNGTIDLGTVITAHQDISGKQDKLTAGSNIQIASDNTISATDTKYTAGTGIAIDSNNIISATSSSGITFDDVYPIGSIYMSVNNTDPSTLFGGTWEQLKDRFLLGAGDTYTAGDTGGEATHQLTKAELPAYDLYNASHSHTITSTAGYNGKQGNNPSLNGGNNQGSGNMSVSATIKVSSGGSDTPHNNMPPYLVVYMWKRTA